MRFEVLTPYVASDQMRICEFSDEGANYFRPGSLLKSKAQRYRTTPWRPADCICCRDNLDRIRSGFCFFKWTVFQRHPCLVILPFRSRYLIIIGNDILPAEKNSFSGRHEIVR